MGPPTSQRRMAARKGKQHTPNTGAVVATTWPLPSFYIVATLLSIIVVLLVFILLMPSGSAFAFLSPRSNSHELVPDIAVAAFPVAASLQPAPPSPPPAALQPPPQQLPPQAQLPLAAPALQPVSAARAITDALRSTAAHLLPLAVHTALAAVGMPDFPASMEAAERTVFTPPGGTRSVNVTAVSNAGFWSLASGGTWEPATFRVYRSVLAARPGVVVDFGSWIGPTVITASLAGAKRVFGLEVDPVAFCQLAFNVATTPEVAAKTSVFFLGIADALGEREFNSGACTTGMGDSCSSMTAESMAPLQRWKTLTMPLSMFFEAEGIRVEDVSLIKVDTEGAEFFILPTLFGWLSQYTGVKPVFWLSLHGKFVKQPNWLQEKASAFMKLFKFGYIESQGVLHPMWSTLSSAHG